MMAALPPGQGIPGDPVAVPVHLAREPTRPTTTRGDHGSQRGRPSGAPRPPPTTRTQSQGSQRPAALSAIASLLEDLQGVAQERVVKFRKVHRLGSGGLAAIRVHCEAFGRVDDVLALLPPQVRRVRPSTLAFVVMADSRAAASVLAAGQWQVVSGQDLVVEAYEHRENGGGSDGSDGAADASSAAAAAPLPVAANGSVARTNEGWLLDDEVISLSSEIAPLHDLDFWPTDDEFD